MNNHLHNNWSMLVSDGTFSIKYLQYIHWLWKNFQDGWISFLWMAEIKASIMSHSMTYFFNVFYGQFLVKYQIHQQWIYPVFITDFNKSKTQHKKNNFFLRKKRKRENMSSTRCVFSRVSIIICFSLNWQWHHVSCQTSFHFVFLTYHHRFSSNQSLFHWFIEW
jgi:hypothetical protein